jgi:hypothetical protein
MADTGRFKMAWEDNEDEYADFYDFDKDMEEGEGEFFNSWLRGRSAQFCLVTSSVQHMQCVHCARLIY